MNDSRKIVALRVVRDVSAAGVAEAVREAVARANGTERLKDARKVLVKPNCVSAFLTPGACTSPWVLDAALGTLRDIAPHAELIAADSDSSARRHVDKGFTLWGYRDICRRHGVKLVNLSTTGWTGASLRTPEGEMPTLLSATALECDAVVSVPVMKTHTWSGGSCCMKNLYGLIGPNRHNHHNSLDQAIVGLIDRFPVALCIVDGTVGLEDGGPVMGQPREEGVIMAGTDPVVTDKAVFDIMGVRAGHVELGLKHFGLPQPELVGDPPPANGPFAPARQNLNSRAHYFLRHLPCSDLLFKTILFHPLRWASTAYQIYWYYRHGSAKRIAFFKASPWAKQFPNRGNIYFGSFKR